MVEPGLLGGIAEPDRPGRADHEEQAGQDDHRDEQEVVPAEALRDHVADRPRGVVEGLGEDESQTHDDAHDGQRDPEHRGHEVPTPRGADAAVALLLDVDRAESVGTVLLAGRRVHRRHVAGPLRGGVPHPLTLVGLLHITSRTRHGSSSLEGMIAHRTGAPGPRTTRRSADGPVARPRGRGPWTGPLPSSIMPDRENRASSRRAIPAPRATARIPIVKRE